MAQVQQLRRGLNADRTGITPAMGEPIFCTDTKKLFIGDGSTAGGIEVGSSTPYADLYNVKLWGAAGDGVTNDTTAIQAAIDAAHAAGGGTVVFPAGTYRIVLSSNIGLNLSGKDNITLSGGGGATIKLANGQCTAATAYYFVLMDANTSNVTISDLTFDGNGDNNATFTVADIITAVGENIVIDNCRIINAPDSGIMFSAVKYSKITNCYIDGNSVSNGAATPATGWTTGATTDVGIYVNDGRTGAGNSGSAEIGYDSGAASLVDCVISGNTVRRFRNGGIALKRVSTGVIVSDNAVTGCGNGITFENASYTGDGSLKCSIMGNRCTDIGWINASAGGRGINLRWSHYSVVSGNTVTNCHGPSLMVEGTQRASICNNVLIGSATLYSTEQKGLVLVARPDGTAANVYSTHNSVTGNVVSAHHRSGIVGDASVYTNLNAKNQIYANVSVGNGVTSGANYSGILLDTAAADDTTPSVLGMRILKTPANTGPTAITQLDDGYAGQEVTVYCGSSTNPSTIADGGNFLLSGGWSPRAAGDAITLVNMDGSTWAEICRSHNINSSPVLTAAADDATPSVLGATHLLIPANTGATAITQLDNAAAGQQVTLVATSATNPSTIADGGNFALSANWTPDINDTITLFTANGTAWREVARSQN